MKKLLIMILLTSSVYAQDRAYLPKMREGSKEQSSSLQTSCRQLRQLVEQLVGVAAWDTQEGLLNNKVAMALIGQILLIVQPTNKQIYTQNKEYYQQLWNYERMLWSEMWAVSTAELNTAQANEACADQIEILQRRVDAIGKAKSFLGFAYRMRCHY